MIKMIINLLSVKNNIAQNQAEWSVQLMLLFFYKNNGPVSEV